MNPPSNLRRKRTHKSMATRRIDSTSRKNFARLFQDAANSLHHSFKQKFPVLFKWSFDDSHSPASRFDNARYVLVSNISMEAKVIPCLFDDLAGLKGVKVHPAFGPNSGASDANDIYH